MDVGLFVDQVFYSATETHVAWLAFFFVLMEMDHQILMEDGFWEVLLSVFSPKSAIHSFTCPFATCFSLHPEEKENLQLQINS